jgi:hypothetical protein
VELLEVEFCLDPGRLVNENLRLISGIRILGHELDMDVRLNLSHSCEDSSLSTLSWNADAEKDRRPLLRCYPAVSNAGKIK